MTLILSANSVLFSFHSDKKLIMKKLLGLLLLSTFLFGLSAADSVKPIGRIQMTDMPEPMYWPFHPEISELTLWCFGSKTLVLFDAANKKNWPLNDIAHQQAKALALEPSIEPILWSKKKEIQDLLLQPFIDSGLEHCP